MLKQHLSQKLLQKLSPQQIQLMKLLQVPTAALEQRIKEELEANPALEEGEESDDLDSLASREETSDYDESPAQEEVKPTDATDNDGELDYEEYEEPLAKDDDVNLDDYIADYIEDDVASYKLSTGGQGEEEEKTIPMAVDSTFHEELERQLGLTDLTGEDEIIARQIIGSIDDDGYLRRAPIAIVDDLAFTQNVFTDEKEVLRILQIVQQFDPPGIGARDLQECLLIQLRRNLRTADPKQPAEAYYIGLAIKVVEKYFNEFSKKHYEKLERQLGIEEEDLKCVLDEILHLNPKPASGFVSNTDKIIQYIVPDFVIRNEDNELELSLNTRNAPELRVSDHYKEMLGTYLINKTFKKPTRQEKEAVMFIKQKIDSAKWFIDAIRQRQQTMYTTMYTIMQFQHDYFKTGDEKLLRPMILKDIADITGLDISTVSRVANSKYVQTEFGTRRLKDFFSESLQTDTGEEVSTLEVKKILTELIQKESKRRPLSDERLKELLNERGYNIARRTVAKYREQFGIPVARLRKQL